MKLCLATCYGQCHHRGIADTSMAGHPTAITRYRVARVDLL